MPPETHVIVITHTPARLRRTLLGLPLGRVAPTSVTLSCDSDDPAIERVARDACAESVRDWTLTLVRRANAGVPRLAQTRNNAVRSLLTRAPANDSVLVFLDGDCVPGPETLSLHRDRLSDPAKPRQLSLGWRLDMTTDQDAAFNLEAMRRGGPPIGVRPEQAKAIKKRHRRYVRQAFWKKLGLARPHKPKILGANFACPLATYLSVNGQDEEFEGWGQEDDDFARRIYQSGGKPAIGIRDNLVYHQYHETLAPPEWKAGRNVALLEADRPSRCVHGLEDPVEQAGVEGIVIG